MSEIIIREKTKEISYETIHDVLYCAHEQNRKNGSVMNTSMLSGEKLEQRIGSQGKCWIAMDGERVVGTTAIKFIDRNTWYAKGKTPVYMLVAVLPEYQGRHISSRLAEAAFSFATQSGYSVIELDTAEDNFHAIRIYEHMGFRLVSYRAPKADHYSVIMVKWFENCPYSRLYCNLRYQWTRFKVRLRYKVGGEKRF